GAHLFATGSVTYANTSISPGDTIEINGTFITYVASGASGNQLNLQSTTNDFATDLNTFINTNTIALGVNSTVLGSVVSITANVAGLSGNSITLSTSNSGSITLSGATLTGGTDDGITILGNNFLTSDVLGVNSVLTNAEANIVQGIDANNNVYLEGYDDGTNTANGLIGFDADGNSLISSGADTRLFLDATNKTSDLGDPNTGHININNTTKFSRYIAEDLAVSNVTFTSAGGPDDLTLGG